MPPRSGPYLGKVNFCASPLCIQKALRSNKGGMLPTFDGKIAVSVKRHLVPTTNQGITWVFIGEE